MATARSNAVFVDTNAWAGYISDLAHHFAQARAYIDGARLSGIPLITTNLILEETFTLLQSAALAGPDHRMNRFDALDAILRIKSLPNLTVVMVERQEDETAWQILRRWQNRYAWSHVDVVSFLVMLRLGLTDALTDDKHFEQAGFNRLLR